MERNYTLGKEVIFDALKCEILADEKIVSLGSRDGAILKLLCEQSNTVVLKEEIHEQVWGKVLVSETSLTKAVSNLRKHLSLFDGVTCEIKTVPKEGYMLITEVPFSDLLWVDIPPAIEIKRVTSSERKLAARPTLSAVNRSDSSTMQMEYNDSFIDLFVRGHLVFFVVFFAALIASLCTIGFMVLWS
ncbi:winged helix-turn-helix domain-containing protein [Vibrio anguillarum]|uniref:winged helix-turn-helix domain-containing protein n=2 Tax=Vibrio anguillarum TaxID=55601 RepID=UPI00098072A2|nr:winged helix-turn-helix domain-containing protein [Vibrio anguillarum]AQP37767.1 transcriptional regulator [Vibrio anguillarum]